jgi:hypothetical protein
LTISCELEYYFKETKQTEMTRSINTSTQLTKFQCSLDRQLNQAFKSFITRLVFDKTRRKEILQRDQVENRTYLFRKYLKILEKGKSGNVQVTKVEHRNQTGFYRNTALLLRFKMITAHGVKLFTAVAMAPKNQIPAPHSVIPIFYNPEDLSVIVLL